MRAVAVPRWSRALLVGFALLGPTGCTMVIDHPVHVVREYPAAEPIDMTVALVLTDELRNAKWEEGAGGNVVVLPLGEDLVRNADGLARTVFSRVTAQQDPRDPSRQDVAATLIPRMVFVEQSLGIWAWSDTTLTLALEWTLKDRQGGVVWIDTVRGTGTTVKGNGFAVRERTRDRVRLAVDDLFRKSFDALSNARPIREFARRQTRGQLDEPARRA